MLENAVTFTSRDKQLIAIEHLPNNTKLSKHGVVIVVGGPQTRVGSHRLFVQLARALAVLGISVFRFDYTGAGDSEGDISEFTAIQADIDAAINCFSSHNPELESLTLWGLCDAASAILLYLQQAIRPQIKISNLILVNPWVRQDHTQAKTYLKSYYMKRFLSKSFWQKLFAGKVEVTNAISDIQDFQQQSKSQNGESSQTFVDEMIQGLAGFSGKSLIILSEKDLTADEFTLLTKSDKNWREIMKEQGNNQHVISQADHTFSKLSCKKQLIEICCNEICQK